MSLTIGLAGMDPATEAALKAAFLEANERLAGRWRLLPETQADHIVVDMDSMYGPMSWLRLHASGKRVVGLTSAMRTQTDFRLGRPFSADSLTALLDQIASGTGAAPGAAPHSGVADADAGVPTSPDSPAAAAAPAAAAPAAAGNSPAAVEDVSPAATPDPEPPPDVPPTTLFGWLASGRLAGRLRYARPGGPDLLIDADAPAYHGPAALKPLAPYFEGEVTQADLEPIEAAAWQQAVASAGEPQPLARLVWLGALVSGKGQLLPGHDPQARYQLSRWPQTEREFPRHFRIATAMMKGPATLAQIAAGTGIPVQEVADFVNANLATGIAEAVPEQPPDVAAPSRGPGLLGRLRGR